MLPLFDKMRLLITCSHCYRKGYYLGIDTDDYVCIFCAKVRATKDDQCLHRYAQTGKNQRMTAPARKGS